MIARANLMAAVMKSFRLSLVNMMSVGVPLALGAVGASIGIGPVFWSVGTCLMTCGFVTRRSGRL